MTPPYLRCLVGSLSALFLNSYAVFAVDDERLTIVVTGTRTAQTVDETLVPVTIIDREQIEQSYATNINDLLQTTPGLNLSVNGGQGSTTSLFLRGTDSDHVLVIIDGIRMSSATLGTASFQNIPLSQIERIEIVRGPRSSLYGSDAIGGVIQIFTRQPKTKSRSDFAIQAGSHSSYGLDAGLSGQKDKGWYSAFVSTFKTDGFNACRAEAATEFGGCFTDETDNDGYNNQSLSLAGGITLSPHIEASMNLLHVDAELDYDGSFSNKRVSTNQIIGTKLNIAASKNWGIIFTAAHNQDHADNFNQGIFASRFDSDRNQLGIQNDVFVGKTGLLTFGLDYYNDEVSSTTDFTISERDNTGIYAQYQGELADSDFQISLRGDDNEQFGTETTGGVSFGKDFGNNLRWTASYGTAFKAPSFNDLYFPDFGNAELDAETAKSLDMGLAGHNKKAHFSANLFQTKINDLITFDAASNAPINVDKARITGLELAAGTRLLKWDVEAALTFLSPKNDGPSSNNGNLLARRPQHSLDINLLRSINKLSLGIGAHTQGHSFDDSANTQRLDSFTTVGVKFSYLIKPQWSVDLALNNLFDKQYETAKYYNQDGFNGLLSLRYIPK